MHVTFFSGGFLYPHRVIVQSDVRLLCVAHEAADGLTDPSVSAYHYMLVEAGVERADVLDLCFLIGFAVQGRGDAWGGA